MRGVTCWPVGPRVGNVTRARPISGACPNPLSTPKVGATLTIEHAEINLPASLLDCVDPDGRLIYAGRAGTGITRSCRSTIPIANAVFGGVNDEQALLAELDDLIKSSWEDPRAEEGHGRARECSKLRSDRARFNASPLGLARRDSSATDAAD